MAVSTLVRHRFLSRSLHTLHETHNDHRGDGVTTPPLHTPCLFLIFGEASPLPSRTSRRRSQALKGHARGTRGRHTMRLSHRASHARPPSTPVNPPARQGARCLSAPAFLSGSRGLQLRRPQACSVPSRRTAYIAMGHARPVGLGIPSKRLRVRRS